MEKRNMLSCFLQTKLVKAHLQGSENEKEVQVINSGLHSIKGIVIIIIDMCRQMHYLYNES